MTNLNSKLKNTKKKESDLKMIESHNNKKKLNGEKICIEFKERKQNNLFSFNFM